MFSATTKSERSVCGGSPSTVNTSSVVEPTSIGGASAASGLIRDRVWDRVGVMVRARAPELGLGLGRIGGVGPAGDA